MGAHHLHLRNASEVIVGWLFLRQQKQAATLNESLPCAAIERTRLRCAQSNQAVCSYVKIGFGFFMLGSKVFQVMCAWNIVQSMA